MNSRSLPADCELGPDVELDVDELEIAPGCRIGFSGADDFRTSSGVRIKARRLVMGAGVQIGASVRIEGGEIRLDEGVRILRHSTIRVLDELQIGAHGTVGEHCEISGRRVRIGQELWMLPGAKIGGGSAFEVHSRLDAGHYLHLGVDTLLNTARPIEIGHEVGLGTRTSLYTHGAYPSRLQGFPVAFEGIQIGDFSWLPGATVNPGVRIGRNCVIGVNSLVTSDIPDGALAAGSPAKVIRENSYPRPLTGPRLLQFYASFLEHYAALLGTETAADVDEEAGLAAVSAGGARYLAALDPERIDAVSEERLFIVGGGALALPGPDGVTLLDPVARYVSGTADAASERLTNELRRYGIRFYSRPRDGTYVNWEASPPSFA